MKFKRSLRHFGTMVGLIIIFLSGPTYAIHGPGYEDIKQPPERLLETGETVIGQPLKYPSDGAPKITALIVTVAPAKKHRFISILFPCSAM